MSIRGPLADDATVTLSRSLVNTSLVLPWYFKIVSRSSSRQSSRWSVNGRNASPSRSKRAKAVETLATWRRSVSLRSPANVT